MDKRRILLLSDQPLLGEALENLIGRLEDIEVVATWTLDEDAVSRIAEVSPDALLIAGSERDAGNTACLMTAILDRYPNLPIFRVNLEDQVIRTYTSQTLSAPHASLMDAIRSLPERTPPAGADDQPGTDSSA